MFSQCLSGFVLLQTWSPSCCNFSFLAHFFIVLLLLRHFVRVHLPLDSIHLPCPVYPPPPPKLCQSPVKVTAQPVPSAAARLRWEERTNKQRKGGERKGKTDQAGAASVGCGSNGWQHKELFSLYFSAPLISELQPAYILIHYSCSDRERTQAGRKVRKQKARDSSNQS